MRPLQLKHLLVSALIGLAVVQSASAATQQELEAYCNEALKRLYTNSPAAEELAHQAQAVLVLPRVYKAGLGFGGEVGEGALRVGGKTADYYRLTGGSFGLQLGMQRKSIVILFMQPAALKTFRDSQGWKAGVDGSVALASLGAGAAIDSQTAKKPIIGFVFGNQGLMYNLSLEGSKLTRISK
jgi:lipid-binding SYLF domain-containing protein